MSNYPPIIITVYKRLDHLQNLILSLVNNKNSQDYHVIIISDGNKGLDDKNDVYRLREYLYELNQFQKIEIVLRARNYGLEKNITSAISSTLQIFDKVIVLEEDLILSKHFIEYITNALALYENVENVISIHGYSYPLNIESSNSTFFIRGADCWGWGTWRRGWRYYNDNSALNAFYILSMGEIRNFNFNFSYPYYMMLILNIFKKKKSWAINWYASAFINNKITLYPSSPLVFNSGLDSSGENCNQISGFNDRFDLSNKIDCIQIDNIESVVHRNAFQLFFKKNFSIIKRLTRYLNRIYEKFNSKNI